MQRRKFLSYIGVGAAAIALPMRNVAALSLKVNSYRKIWAPEDIKGGLFIVRCYDFGEDKGKLASVCYQIGYSHQLARINENFGSKYVFNSVADGWTHGMMDGKVHRGLTKEEMAAYLNADKYGYRIATEHEMHAIISHLHKNLSENIESVSSIHVNDRQFDYHTVNHYK